MSDFSQRYENIYEKYLTLPESDVFGKSKLGMARFLNASQGRAQHWESGRMPNAVDCLTISDKLGFKLRWVISGEGEMSQDGPPAGLAAETGRLKDRLIALQDELNEARKEIIALTKELAEARGVPGRDKGGVEAPARRNASGQ